MNYDFPHIHHIDEVLDAIKDKSEFTVAKKDGYIVINYVINGDDTFPPVKVSGGSKKMREERERTNKLLRECRGITFDSETGNVISRKFHKFFNVGERGETFLKNLDFSQPHVVTEKLDGSMLCPVMIKGAIVWCTKMGDTDVAKLSSEFLETHPEYNDLAQYLLVYDHTPIFEFCSNKQRIVMEHPEDRLVLLAIRDNITGEYDSYERLSYIAKFYGIECVREFSSINGDALEYIETLRQRDDIEGVVVTFNDGHRVKIKTDFYVRLHKVKDAINSERKIVDLILNQA